MRHALLWASLAVPALLAACAKPETPVVQSTRPVYAIDMMGAAKLCTVPDDPKLVDAQQTEVAMTVGNDGGWCGVKVSRPGPAPFDAGLLVGRPEHGRVQVHAVGDWTRVDYTPDPGFVGTDAFTVRLLPGSTTLRVNATVQGVAQPVAAAAPVVTPRVTAPTPASTSSKPAASKTTTQRKR
ncbi:Ig-like domain-containing protein [Roseomonas sp. E05]|uniref:Ig-like domain-containing protein n=1 Tax=Roseomonas sp. E05 TaxID=3046310 RepID=UPI0024BA6064|nr:Ig-like domain-containing protein [Roseomonas sp. E05]MDJ0388973.1 Ig-like domain-containing protein [Roseomonas sp. E05]